MFRSSWTILSIDVGERKDEFEEADFGRSIELSKSFSDDQNSIHSNASLFFFMDTRVNKANLVYFNLKKKVQFTIQNKSRYWRTTDDEVIFRKKENKR